MASASYKPALIPAHGSMAACFPRRPPCWTGTRRFFPVQLTIASLRLAILDMKAGQPQLPALGKVAYFSGVGKSGRIFFINCQGTPWCVGCVFTAVVTPGGAAQA